MNLLSACVCMWLPVASIAKVLPIFFRPIDPTDPFLASSNGVQLNPPSKWLADSNVTHYRLIPGLFPEGMEYHFDGLATVLSFSFSEGKLSAVGKPFASQASKNWNECLFEGSGTTHKGIIPCLQNPVVNLLPIDGQIWLTIDQRFWGRIDPKTLDTIPSAKADVPWLTLNAHPACDPHTKECFVQHPCPSTSGVPLSAQVCVSKLLTSNGPAANLQTRVLANTTSKTELLLQHSHSPCVTNNFVVSKLDSFGPKSPSEVRNGTSGLLRNLHQIEDDQWLVMDRRTNEGTVMRGDLAFVNNHAWNCFENAEGDVVVDVVAATEDYLDTYFEQNLTKGAEWKTMFKPAQRCIVPVTSDSTTVHCSQLLSPKSSEENKDELDLVFDYPTFNPLFKMRSDYSWFYGIAPSEGQQSAWFSRIIKFDARTRTVAAEWTAPNVFVTEADFIPRSDSQASEDEDDGVLVSILYNATSDSSMLGVFDAKTLDQVDSYALAQVVPFHAHGISCKDSHCFSNP